MQGIFDFDLIRYVLVLVHKTLFDRLPDIFFGRILALFPVNVVTDFPVGDDDNFFSLIYMFSVSCTLIGIADALCRFLSCQGNQSVAQWGSVRD